MFVSGVVHIFPSVSDSYVEAIFIYTLCGHDCTFTSELNEAFCTGKQFLSHKVVHAGGGIGGVFLQG